MKTVFIDQATAIINNSLIVVIINNASVIKITVMATIVVRYRKSRNQASAVMIIKLNHM
jgi:hypothetical protein